MNRIRRVSVALTIASALGVAAPVAASAVPTISISGSTASAPLVSKLAAKYAKLKPHTVKFKIAQGGSQIGINEVAQSKVSIGDVSREGTSSDPAHLYFTPIAKYAICIVTNKSNTLSNLNGEQAISIFTGKTTNWSQVPGATAMGPIDLISRTSVAGVLTSFQTLLLKNNKVSSHAEELGSEGLLRARVEGDPGAIGFLSNYQAALGSLNSVGFKGVPCNKATATSGQYEGIARFNEVTRGPGAPKGFIGSFINWITKSAAARKIISSQWIPIN